MSIVNWIKNKMVAIAIATSGVEKNALNQSGKKLEENVESERKMQSNDLLQALKNGEVNQEVRNLRWRTYKVMNEAQKVKANLHYKYKTNEDGTREIELDEDGNMIFDYTIEKKDKVNDLAHVKVDTSDNYPVEMVVYNDAITKSILSVIENMTEGPSSESYYAGNMNDKPIHVIRDFMPKFEIENYTKKLVVRTINETEKLLEFYISKYEDPDNFSTKMLITELKKLMANGPEKINSIEIKEVGFVTHKTVGKSDFLAYGYQITSFDKIVEFDGNYVLKFKTNLLVDGASLFDKFREEELDKLYENKEKKNVTI